MVKGRPDGDQFLGLGAGEGAVEGGGEEGAEKEEEGSGGVHCEEEKRMEVDGGWSDRWDRSVGGSD